MAGTCKLCDKETDKFPKSHIIPDFMYKSLKNEKSQIFRLHMPENKPRKPIFTGYYDLNLLCYDCERKISKLESYAEKVLYGGIIKPLPEVLLTRNATLQKVTNIDYKIFKLFLLSILWRAGESENEFFKNVRLGEKHATRLKKILFTENPGDETDYPIALLIAKGPVGRNVGILPPYMNKSRQNATRYVFIIAEVVYVFHVSAHGLDDLQWNATIKKDNTMHVLYLPSKRSDFYLQLYNVKEEIQKVNALNRLGLAASVTK